MQAILWTLPEVSLPGLMESTWEVWQRLGLIELKLLLYPYSSSLLTQPSCHSSEG